MGKSRGNKPQPRGGKSLSPAPSASEAVDTGKDHPWFCLNCQQPGYMISDLDTEGQIALLDALHMRRGMTWNELTLAGRHGLGFEWLPVSDLRARLPDGFADRDRVMVFRYRGMLPMAGLRQGRVFHLLFIEKHYGDLYDHGGS